LELSSCLPVRVSRSTGCRGQTQLNAIAAGIANANAGQSLGLVIALVFVVAGVGSKSPLPSTSGHQTFMKGPSVIAFLSVGSKAAGFALAIRLMTTAFP